MLEDRDVGERWGPGVELLERPAAGLMLAAARGTVGAVSIMRRLTSSALVPTTLLVGQGRFVHEVPCRPAILGCQCDFEERCDAPLRCVASTCVHPEGGASSGDGGARDAGPAAR